MTMCRVFAAVAAALLGGCKPMFPTDAAIAEQCHEHFASRGGNADAIDKCIKTNRIHRDQEMALWAVKSGRY